MEGSGPAGQHRELHVAQLSMTTRERERRERKSERETAKRECVCVHVRVCVLGGACKSSAAVRERSVGAESEEQSTQ